MRNPTPDIYILVSGSLQLLSKSNDLFNITPVSMIGQSDPLPCTLKPPFKAVTSEDSIFLKIPYSSFRTVINSHKSHLDKERMLEFIASAVPGAKQLGRYGRQTILSLCKKHYFKPGQVLLREGAIANYIYIIMQGECSLVKLGHELANPNVGLISNTLSTANYGLIVRGQWVGEVSVIENSPMEFSVLASTPVEALKLRSNTFLEGFPRLIYREVEKNVLTKKSHWDERKGVIQDMVTSLKVDHSDYERTVAYARKVYPVASKHAISSLRRMKLAQNHYNCNDMISTPFYRKQTTSPKENTTNSQLRTQNGIAKQTQEQKSLAFNSTVKARLVPVLKKSKVEKPAVKKSSSRPITPAERFGYTQNKKEYKLYAHFVRNKRPPSLNLADQLKVKDL